jgi:TrmH family RNA methyltransferase
MKTITSAENPRFRSLLRLAQSSRERKQSGLSLLDGIHLVTAYLQHVGSPQELVISRSGLDHPEIQALLADAAAEAWILADGLFRQLSSVVTPTGVVALVPTPNQPLPERITGASLWLEDLQDPGNLGSILRSAAAAGVGTVCLSPQTVHAWSPRVLRAGMGAHFALRIVEGVDLPALAGRYHGRMVATRLHAKTAIYEVDLTGDVALMFGNEGAGLSPALAARAGIETCIPMPGNAESLNVAAAAAVCLFERVRQIRAQ